MTHTEFDIIQDFFAQQKLRRTDVALGIGDDCALVCAPSDCDIAITTDTLVENVHFTLDTSAADIGFKSLAVNLSDLAAMGATPAWFSCLLYTSPSPRDS